MGRRISDYLIPSNWLQILVDSFNHIRDSKKGSKIPDSNPLEKESISAIKESKNQNPEDPVSYSFMEDSKNTDKIKEENKRVRPLIPMDLNNPYVLSQLKGQIIISPYDDPEILRNRLDLEFIGISKINDRGIYKYIGSDFSKFDLPFEEIFF